MVVIARQQTKQSRSNLLVRDCFVASLLAMTAFFFFNIPSAFACPFCKEAISKMGNVWFAIGLNWSIYLMIAVPFILVGSFGSVLYLNYRKHQKHES